MDYGYHGLQWWTRFSIFDQIEIQNRIFLQEILVRAPAICRFEASLYLFIFCSKLQIHAALSTSFLWWVSFWSEYLRVHQPRFCSGSAQARSGASQCFKWFSSAVALLSICLKRRGSVLSCDISEMISEMNRRKIADRLRSFLIFMNMIVNDVFAATVWPFDVLNILISNGPIELQNVSSDNFRYCKPPSVEAEVSNVVRHLGWIRSCSDGSRYFLHLYFKGLPISFSHCAKRVDF